MKGSAPRRRTSRRKMNGMSSKAMMDDVNDIVQVGAGLLLFGLASNAARKQFPDTNGHILNLGAVAAAVVLGGSIKQARKVAIGFGGGAVANSVMNLLPSTLMQGHTLNRRNLTAAQQQAIAAEMRKAQARMDSGMGAGGTLNGELETLNGAADDLM